ncbi:ribonuclease HIII [Bacilli bacterium]|nr:ribonuclease HIII [Bacilli bacterium]
MPHPNNPTLLYLYKVDKKTISIYRTFKMLVQGPNADEFGKALIGEANQLDKKPITADYIGCDEVGVGDYFGGLVTCAVYLKKADENALRVLGVKDSKNLSDAQMIKMAPSIYKIVKFACLVYAPEKYNELVGKFHNTHAIKTCMHDKTIKKLVKDNGLSENVSVIMDQYAEKSTYYKYFKILNIEHPFHIARFETKAENKYLAVAAASIIARVAFLKHMDELGKQIGMKLLLGASNPKIIDQAKLIYKKGNRSLLNKYVKIDFKTTTKVVNDILH